MANEAPIGVFDSGIGGLTVVREIMREMPKESIIYFGDTARVPYGSKSRKTILTYARQIVQFLQSKNVKAIVIACNTATAFALEDLRAEVTIPVIGVIEPGAKMASKATRNKQIGVIGTEGTIQSGIYQKMIAMYDPSAKVYGKACPLFVPLVEEGMLQDSVTIEMAKRYLLELQQRKIDTLVLGCTHYPLLKETIQSVVGSDIILVNPAAETAKQLKHLLQEKKMEKEIGLAGYHFFVSDAAEKFKNFANTILSCDVKEIEHISVERYGMER